MFNQSCTLFVVKIEKPDEEEPFMSEGTAEIMIKMMRTVVDSGTARRLRYRYGLTMPIAGKTGTTQNQADGWFMGFTSNLVGGVWVGGANRHIRFRDIGNGQGANMALPIWGIFMQKVVKDKSFNHVRQSFFRSPADSVQLMLDCPYYVDEIWPMDIEEYLNPEELEEHLRVNERPDEDLSDMEIRRAERLNAKAEKKRAKELEDALKAKKQAQKSANVAENVQTNTETVIAETVIAEDSAQHEESSAESTDTQPDTDQESQSSAEETSFA